MLNDQSLKIILSVDPVKYPLTGIGRYTYELANALLLSGEVADLRFMQGRHLHDRIPGVGQSSFSPIARIKKKVQNSRIVTDAYRLLAPGIKAYALKGFQDYLYHGPNFYLPPFRGKNVVTIHDLSVYNLPESHPSWRVRYMKAEIDLSLRRAALVLTDSEFVKREIVEQFNYPSDQIHVIALASAEEYHLYDASEIAPILSNYKLSSGGYTLFTGTIEPRKNIDTLLDAYLTLPMPFRKQWPLVLCGYEGWNSKKIHRRIHEAVGEGWAMYLGFVPSMHLPALFSGARLFAYPSLYEGFGLPVLEAMASGVPVVCSNASSLPEVVGDAAGMCDACDFAALGRLIERGLTDETWRDGARKKGLKRSKLFSWNRCARETIKAYKTALM